MVHHGSRRQLHIPWTRSDVYREPKGHGVCAPRTARRQDALQTETCTRCIHVPGYTTHTQLTQAFHAQKIDTKDKKQRAMYRWVPSSEFREFVRRRISDSARSAGESATEGGHSGMANSKEWALITKCTSSAFAFTKCKCHLHLLNAFTKWFSKGHSFTKCHF